MIKQEQGTKALRGILLMIAAVTFFNVKDGLAKHLSETYPIIELLFFQYAVMCIIILPIIVIRDGNFAGEFSRKEFEKVKIKSLFIGSRNSGSMEQ